MFVGRSLFAPLAAQGIAVAALTALLAGCGPQSSAPAPAGMAANVKTVQDFSLLKPQAIGAAINHPPWIAHVLPIDLDRDGLLDLVACEAQDGSVVWIRQAARGVFE